MSLAISERRLACQGKPHRQQGMSMTMMLIVAAVATFLGLFAFKVGPHYFSYMTVKTVAENLAESPETLKLPRSQVLTWVDKQYRTNNLWDYKADETILLQKSEKDSYAITVQYERRTNLFHNIDLVTRFDTPIN